MPDDLGVIGCSSVCNTQRTELERRTKNAMDCAEDMLKSQITETSPMNYEMSTLKYLMHVSSTAVAGICLFLVLVEVERPAIPILCSIIAFACVIVALWRPWTVFEAHQVPTSRFTEVDEPLGQERVHLARGWLDLELYAIRSGLDFESPASPPEFDHQFSSFF